MSELPIVLLPLGADEDALDACLAALEANTPAGTPVWLADDAQAGPRGIALVERWLQRTGLRAEYTRRSHPIGQVAHLQQMLQACGDADAVLLAPDARPLPGWLSQLAAWRAMPPSPPPRPGAMPAKPRPGPAWVKSRRSPPSRR